MAPRNAIAADSRSIAVNEPNALVWSADHLRIASNAAGVALWSWNVDTDEIALDERAHGLWAVSTADAIVTFDDLSENIHVEDLNRVRTAFANTRTMTGSYEIDFRVVHHDHLTKWISARGECGDTGMVDRVMFGVFMDVTDRKQAEEIREVFAAEMSHRVKNLFALATALTRIAARSAATTEEMANDLTLRLTALGRAHDVVRPVPGEQSKALLADLLSVLLAPYSHQGADGDWIAISMPEIRVGEATATALAMVVHELATNSVKYGALSRASGRLNVSCTANDDEIVMLWTERDGPAIGAAKRPEGFGSKLIAQSVYGQLGGSIAFDWAPAGAVVTLRMSKGRLAR